MSRFTDFLSTITCNTEEDIIADVQRIAEPADSKEQMGQDLEDVLGYNPLTHHDSQTLRNLIETIAPSANEPTRDLLLADIDIIVKKTLDLFHSRDEEYLKKALFEVIIDEYGWICEELCESTSFEIDDDDDIDDDDSDEFDDED